MAEAEIRQSGLATLEEGHLSDAPYTGYWTDVYSPALRALKPDTKSYTYKNIEALGQFTADITQQVVREGDVQGVGTYPYIMEHVTPSLYAVLEAWDKSLGSFSAMSDGQGDLLRAAGLLIASNV